MHATAHALGTKPSSFILHASSFRFVLRRSSDTASADTFALLPVPFALLPSPLPTARRPSASFLRSPRLLAYKVRRVVHSGAGQRWFVRGAAQCGRKAPALARGATRHPRPQGAA